MGALSTRDSDEGGCENERFASRTGAIGVGKKGATGDGSWPAVPFGEN